MIARKQAWCAAVCFLYSRATLYWSKWKIVKKWTTLQTPLKHFKTLVSDYHPVRSAEASHLGVLGYVVIDHLQLINNQKVWDRLLATDLVLPLVSSRMHGSPGVQHAFLSTNLHQQDLHELGAYLPSNTCTLPPLKQSKLHMADWTTSTAWTEKL